ncbi:MAG TPA: hypothetical protein PK668_13640 [Myxococcota bacterium]|nr:hypothetical protein [Myxococcota bacterium]HRY94095.1 hypothetical protein [Myxococcota bacterium]
MGWIALGLLSLGAARAGEWPGLDVRGQALVVGRVFEDLDGDGRFSAGERGLPGVRLLTDGGLQALTDADGLFHLQLLAGGLELQAGHLVVLDRSSLPAGARVSGTSRRLLHLAPLETVQVSFPVRSPAAEPGGPSPLPARQGHPGLALRAQAGALWGAAALEVPEGCWLEADGQPLELDPARLALIPVPLAADVNSRLVVLACEDGRLEAWLLRLHRVLRPSGGALVVPGAPRALAVCQGSRLGEVERTRSVELDCRSLPGASLSLGAQRVGQVTRRLVLEVEPGPNTFPLEVVLDGGGRLASQVTWQVRQVSATGALLGTAALGYAFGGGAEGVYLGGRLRGQLEASLPLELRLRLSGGLESSNLEGLAAGQAARQVLGPARDPGRWERAPDPEAGWSLSGDDGALWSVNPSASRYRLELLRKASRLGYGEFALDDGASLRLGQVRRSLVGAFGRVSALEDVFGGPAPALQLELDGFWARPDPDPSSAALPVGPKALRTASQLPAHEELLATGGSLYFLGHGWVVEGSERLLVEARDARTGLPLAQRRLRRGVDYEVDWSAGRILLTQPLDPGLLTGSAIRLAPLGGRTTVLVADYEHLALADTDPRDTLVGGRVGIAGRPGGGLVLEASGKALGGLSTGDSADYLLWQTSARAALGELLEVWAGYTRTQGHILTPAYSLDGGLSFLEAPAPRRAQGEALEAGLELALEGLRSELRYRRWLEGFADGWVVASGDLNQFIGSIDATPWEDWIIHAAATTDQRAGGLAWDTRLGIRNRPIEPLEIALEASFEAASPRGSGLAAQDFAALRGDGQRSLVGLRANWEVLPGWSLFAGHQQAVYLAGVGRPARDLSLASAGTQLALTEGLAVGLEAGWGPEIGNLVRLGLSEQLDGERSSFAYTTFTTDGSAVRQGGWTAGQSGRTEQGWLVSSGQSWSALEGGQAAGQQVAVEIPLGSPWRLKLAYERAEADAPADGLARADLLGGPFEDRVGAGLGRPGRRNALFGRLAYVGERLQLSTAAEYRVEEHLPLAGLSGAAADAASAHRQAVLRLGLRWTPLAGLALGGRVAWAETFGGPTGDDGPGLPEGGFFEGSAAVVWRPGALPWLALLARAAGGEEQAPARAEAELGQERWAMGTLAVHLAPWSWLQPSLALAPWWSAYTPADGPSAERVGLLGLLRLSSEVWAGLGLSVEARLAVNRPGYDLALGMAAEPAAAGFALEAFYRLANESLGGLRLGVGYSFSDIPDPLLSDLHAGRQGVFIRLEGDL